MNSELEKTFNNFLVEVGGTKNSWMLTDEAFEAIQQPPAKKRFSLPSQNSSESSTSSPIVNPLHGKRFRFSSESTSNLTSPNQIGFEELETTKTKRNGPIPGSMLYGKGKDPFASVSIDKLKDLLSMTSSKKKE